MSRDVRLPRSCRQPVGRLALLAISLAIPTGAPFAQTSIPFGSGVVLTYVTHNFHQPQGREFHSTIESVTPDEKVFVEDMHYTGPDGTGVTVPYHRHQSRRELSKAMVIDEGTTCNPGDTVVTARHEEGAGHAVGLV